MEAFRKLFIRCQAKNIKLARHKMEAGHEVKFVGTHVGGEGGYRPTQAKIDAIMNPPPPSYIREL